MRKLEKHLSEFLTLENFDIVGFYPYTSVVIGRILEQNHNYETEEKYLLTLLFDSVIEELEKHKISNDNKIVVELRLKTNRFCREPFLKIGSLFIGKYDNIISLGMGVYQPDQFTAKGNKYIVSDFKVGDKVIYCENKVDVIAEIAEVRDLEYFPILLKYGNETTKLVNRNEITLLSKK